MAYHFKVLDWVYPTTRYGWKSQRLQREWSDPLPSLKCCLEHCFSIENMKTCHNCVVEVSAGLSIHLSDCTHPSFAVYVTSHNVSPCHQSDHSQVSGSAPLQ